MFVATAMTYRHWFSPIDNHIVLKAVRIFPYYDEIYELLMPGALSIRRILTPKAEVYFYEK
ncbi:hypothetical protein [Coxiella-like endosymbiont]|uniref:hypothetical protein n=1 Tax=Coxiella-like endosymbiont TaxID=1592897 RepID=UPI00272C415A|nr:hypothetical protein [Coxiella-like endosymbiont]